MAEQKVSVPAIEKWVVPFGASQDILVNILKTFYVAGADAKFVSRDEVIQRGIDRTPLVNNLQFLVSLGALEKDEASKNYKLTPTGLEYSRAAYSSDKEKIATSMKSLIEGSFHELVDYTKLNKETLNFTDLFNHIKAMARIKEDDKYPPWNVNPAYRLGIFALIDMLKTAGLIDASVSAPTKSAEKLPIKARAQKPQPRSSVTQKRAKNKEEQPSEKETPIKSKELVLNAQIQAQLVVDTKDEKSVENFLKIIKALKQQELSEDS